MRRLMNEAGLWLIGIPVFLWTVLPLYHMMLFALSTKDSAFSGKVWPQPATLRNFEIVLSQQHHYLGNFWAQLGSSVLIAAAGLGALLGLNGSDISSSGGRNAGRKAGLDACCPRAAAASTRSLSSLSCLFSASSSRHLASSRLRSSPSCSSLDAYARVSCDNCNNAGSGRSAWAMIAPRWRLRKRRNGRPGGGREGAHLVLNCANVAVELLRRVAGRGNRRYGRACAVRVAVRAGRHLAREQMSGRA